MNEEEFSSCDNCSRGLVNPSGYDPRGVLPGNPAVNQPGPSGHGTSNLGIAMLTVGLSHEFDNAWKIEGKASARERNNGPDIYGHYMIDLYAGISHPQYGSLTIDWILHQLAGHQINHLRQLEAIGA